MKTLIQNRNTKPFFQRDGGWAEDQGKAMIFPSALAAFQFSQVHELGETEVLFVQENGVEKIVRESHEEILSE